MSELLYFLCDKDSRYNIIILLVILISTCIFLIYFVFAQYYYSLLFIYLFIYFLFYFFEPSRFLFGFFLRHCDIFFKFFYFFIYKNTKQVRLIVNIQKINIVHTINNFKCNIFVNFLHFLSFTIFF